METKQAVLPLSAPVSTSILLCFGNRHNHITVFDETIFVSSMTLYRQAGRPYIQTPFLLCKMLVGIVPNPLCTASAGCRLRICAKCFYNEKEHRGLPKNGKNPRCSLFIGSALYPWGPFLLRKTSLHSSELSSVPASRSVPCGSPGRLLSSWSAVLRTPHPTP